MESYLNCFYYNLSMKRGNLVLTLFLISILFISGCGPEMAPGTGKDWGNSDKEQFIPHAPTSSSSSCYQDEDCEIYEFCDMDPGAKSGECKYLTHCYNDKHCSKDFYCSIPKGAKSGFCMELYSQIPNKIMDDLGGNSPEQYYPCITYGGLDCGQDTWGPIL